MLKIVKRSAVSFRNLFFLIASLGLHIVSCEPQSPFKEFDLLHGDKMFVVPVPRNEWHPTTQIKASYVLMNQAEQLEDPTVSSTEAIFSINATDPSINVDNFPSIKKVECSRNDTVKLTFVQEQISTLP